MVPNKLRFSLNSLIPATVLGVRECGCLDRSACPLSNVPFLAADPLTPLDPGVPLYLVHQDFQTVPQPLADLHRIAAALREKAWQIWGKFGKQYHWKSIGKP